MKGLAVQQDEARIASATYLPFQLLHPPTYLTQVRKSEVCGLSLSQNRTLHQPFPFLALIPVLKLRLVRNLRVTLDTVDQV